MKKTRAVRFSDQEEKKLTEFLAENPFFDFSSLARLAIIKFIEKPELDIKPVRSKGNSVTEGRLV